MTFKQGIIAAAFLGMLSAPAVAGDTGAELERLGETIDERSLELSTEDRTKVLSVYFAGLEAYDDGDEETAREKLAEAEEILGK